MKFETPAGINPIDQLNVIGKPTDRIEGPLKTTGTAKYAYEHNDEVTNPAYGYVVGAGIAKGRIKAIDQTKAKAAPGVLAIVTAASVGPLQTGKFYVDRLLAGPDIDHYHQAIAVVVAETFEQARACSFAAENKLHENKRSLRSGSRQRLGPLPRQRSVWPTSDKRMSAISMGRLRQPRSSWTKPTPPPTRPMR